MTAEKELKHAALSLTQKAVLIRIRPSMLENIGFIF